MRKALLAAVAVAALASAAPATVMKKLTLGEIEGYASEVFTGKVLSIDTALVICELSHNDGFCGSLPLLV